MTAVLLVGALSGCGSSATAKLNTSAVERAIANSVLAERHIYSLVSCPNGIPQQAGRVFNCTARLKVGAYPVLVTETDGHGHIHYSNATPLTVLDMARVTHAIKASILAQRKLHAHVSCPTDVLQQKGLSFTCTAKVAGRGYPFTVTEADGYGHVRYVGR
jgi:hypothetical protein